MLSRFENDIRRRDLFLMGLAITDIFFEAESRKLIPRKLDRITIHMASTSDLAQAEQQLTFFNYKSGKRHTRSSVLADLRVALIFDLRFQRIPPSMYPSPTPSVPQPEVTSLVQTKIILCRRWRLLAITGVPTERFANSPTPASC